MGTYGEFIHVRSLPPRIGLSAASGLFWALIASVIGYRVFGPRIWGGIILAPLIGVMIGRLSSPLRNRARWVQIAGSLFSLYIAGVCFAIGMAVGASALGGRVKFSAAVIEHVWAVAWGLTFGGYALVLWPLSFFNHRLVWQADAGLILAAPEVHTTNEAARTLGVRIMALSVLGYGVWALLQTVLATIRSSTSTMPWWVVTSLMAWSGWLVFGLLIWVSAPMLAFGATAAAGSPHRSTARAGELLGVIGFAILAFPILSCAATLIVTAIKVSLVHSWATEGTAFSGSRYYRNMLRMYMLWFLAGGAMIGLRWLVQRSRGDQNSDGTDPGSNGASR